MVAEYWASCKTQFITSDFAFILRLQVEYDHFVLRAITAIMSSQRNGVWKFLSVIPFHGVSESMMWHILLIVYNCGQDEFNKFCPYLDVSSWKLKLLNSDAREPFMSKLSELSQFDSEYIVTTLFNMAWSRSYNDIDFVSTTAGEIFEIGFQNESLSKKFAPMSKKLLVNLTHQHPFLISTFLKKIADGTTVEEVILTKDYLKIYIFIQSYFSRLQSTCLSTCRWYFGCQMSKSLRFYLNG